MDHPRSSIAETRRPVGRAAPEIRIAGLLSVMIALPYVARLMPMEQEVAAWGMFSLGLGVLLLIVSRAQRSRAAAWLTWVLLISLVLMQVPPISLWLTLGVLTDHPWIERGVAMRLAFAAAHTAVLLAGLWAMVAVARTRPGHAADIAVAALAVALLAAALLHAWPW